MENHESYLTENIIPIREYSHSLKIADNDENMLALAQLERIKKAQKWVKENLDPVVDQAHKAHKAATELRRKFTDPLSTAEQDIKGAMVRYNRQIEDDRRRLQAEAEAKARAEEDRQRKAIEAQAAKAAKSGKAAKAEALLEKAESVSVVAQIVAPVVEKPKNVSYVKYWEVEVVSRNEIPREFMIPNDAGLRNFVNSTKGTVPIKGCRITEKERMTVRD